MHFSSDSFVAYNPCGLSNAIPYFYIYIYIYIICDTLVACNPCGLFNAISCCYTYIYIYIYTSGRKTSKRHCVPTAWRKAGYAM